MTYRICYHLTVTTFLQKKATELSIVVKVMKMAFLQKVRIMIRFNRCGKWVMKPAMWSDNKRYLVPRRAKGMSQTIAGEYTYYLRYYSPRLRKRVYESVGKDSVMAVADANTRDIELITAARGLANVEDRGAVPPWMRIDNAIHSYLAPFHKQRTTLLAYRRALEIFREVCDCTYVDEISIGFCLRTERSSFVRTKGSARLLSETAWLLPVSLTTFL